MYGKAFASMYERSMVGVGALVFAVWGYVIAKAVPDKKVGAQVTLNPDLLGPILGESPADVKRAIDFLCSPDPRSTTKEEQGRRLVKIGEFDFKVVSHAKYRAMRNEEERREQNRLNKQSQRARAKGKPLPGEDEYVRNVQKFGQEAADKILDEKENGKTP